jgi:hypothetical protein
MALDNNNPKIHEETPETREVTDDQKIEAKKDVDMEDALLSRTAQWDEKDDIDLGLFVNAFDDLPEKDETKKLEQDFVNSDSEKQTWKSLSLTSSFEEDSSSNEEEEESITGLSTKVPNSSFLTTYYSNIERTSSHRHHVSHSLDRKSNVPWRFTSRRNRSREN